MKIETWQQAKNAGLSQKALQKLCDYDIVLVEKIKSKLKNKHPNASDKQIECWAQNCLRKKMQQEHWGFSVF